jgi:hypothetical protein
MIKQRSKAVLADSKVYMNGFGTVIQSQTKSMTNSQVFASESKALACFFFEAQMPNKSIAHPKFT